MKGKNIAIIPARGGSKRIPRKNIKLFFGKPILAYSIKAAQQSKCFVEVMVSTDDPKIAAVGKKLGAKVPFLRSAKSASDMASLEDVVLEVLKEYAKIGKLFDNVCCILPTAPFIRPADIKKALSLLNREKEIVSVFTVTKFNYPIQRAFKIKDGWLKMQWPENINRRSQDLEPMYHDAGQFYCLKTEKFLKEKRLFSKMSKSLILPGTRVQDIDDLEDWQNAAIKFKILVNKEKGLCE